MSAEENGGTLLEYLQYFLHWIIDSYQCGSQLVFETMLVEFSDRGLG